ncbi:unnamed protein product, partial [Staurois parvus]
VRIPGQPLSSAAGPYLFLYPAARCLPGFFSVGTGHDSRVPSQQSSPVLSAVSGHPCTVQSLWSSPVLCPQSLVIPCTVSAVSGHPLYCVRSLWSSPVLCPQSLVI